MPYCKNIPLFTIKNKNKNKQTNKQTDKKQQQNMELQRSLRFSKYIFLANTRLNIWWCSSVNTITKCALTVYRLMSIDAIYSGSSGSLLSLCIYGNITHDLPFVTLDIEELAWRVPLLGLIYLCLCFVYICSKPFWCWDRNIPGQLDQHHNCWCPGSLCHQAISSHGINYVWNRLFDFQEEECQIPVSFQCEGMR